MRTKKVFFNTQETITKTKRGWIEIDFDFTQVYDCFSNISAKIKSATTFKLLFWLLANKMNDENGINCSTHSFEEFNNHLTQSCGGCEINYRTYLRAIKELNEVGALTKVGKGHYYANPHMFWAGDKDGRINFLELEANDPELKSLNPMTSKEK